ncbi:MAG: beta-phosphoglucomutase [Saprospiraceae bacterium]|nr:beta-phosphoglucomutase [Saprospiraceae bacterium]NNL91622.1 beta-phosphoglucomutase [Saprospiraceae bacterium]
MIQACIFDLDGVIVDTAKYHFIAWAQMAKDLGISFTEKENENLKGVGRMESLEYILSLGNVEKSDQEKTDLAQLKNEHYKQLISNINNEEILPGVVSLLDELKSSHIKIALGSSSKNARGILNALDLMKYFDVVVDGTDITKSKPDPQVFTMGADQLKLSPSHIVVFEDAYNGIEAAKQGGFFAIGVGDENELDNADVVIPGMADFNLNTLKQVASL